MRIYKPIDVALSSKSTTTFIINNLNAISSSILSIISAVKVCRGVGDYNTQSISDNRIGSWATSDRPTKTVNDVTMGVNTTTNKIEHTVDGGTTWYNADGSAV